MCNGDVLRNIPDYLDALLHVFMQKVSAELRIKDAGRKKTQGHEQQNRDNGYEQIGDDQAIAQAPEKLAPPAADKTNDEIKSRQNREVFQKAEGPSLDIK